MNKRKLTALFLSALILGQGFATSVYASESQNQIVNSVEVQEGKSELIGIYNLEYVISEDFDVYARGDEYSRGFKLEHQNTAYMTVTFNEPAISFTLKILDSSGSTLHSQEFYRANNGEGVNKIKTRWTGTEGQTYTFVIKNNDSVTISGNSTITGN